MTVASVFYNQENQSSAAQKIIVGIISSLISFVCSFSVSDNTMSRISFDAKVDLYDVQVNYQEISAHMLRNKFSLYCGYCIPDAME